MGNGKETIYIRKPLREVRRLAAMVRFRDDAPAFAVVGHFRPAIPDFAIARR